MDELRNKPRVILVLLILGSILALMASWHSPHDESENTQ
jgi:hypothetical protein